MQADNMVRVAAWALAVAARLGFNERQVLLTTPALISALLARWLPLDGLAGHGLLGLEFCLSG